MRKEDDLPTPTTPLERQKLSVFLGFIDDDPNLAQALFEFNRNADMVILRQAALITLELNYLDKVAGANAQSDKKSLMAQVRKLGLNPIKLIALKEQNAPDLLQIDFSSPAKRFPLQGYKDALYTSKDLLAKASLGNTQFNAASSLPDLRKELEPGELEASHSYAQILLQTRQKLLHEPHGFLAVQAIADMLAKTADLAAGIVNPVLEDLYVEGVANFVTDYQVCFSALESHFLQSRNQPASHSSKR